MRRLLTRLLATAASLYLTSLLVGGFSLSSAWPSYFVASLVFIIINTLASPFIKLLLLPINLLTLGLFRWLTNVIVLYLFDLLYRGVTISAYEFPGYSSSLIALPPLHLSFFWTLVVSSFFISLTYSLASTFLRND